MYAALEKAQTRNEYDGLEEFVGNAILAGFKIVERV